jgi:hypothetical protein
LGVEEIAARYNPIHTILSDVDRDSLDTSCVKNISHISEFCIVPDRDHIAGINYFGFATDQRIGSEMASVH